MLMAAEYFERAHQFTDAIKYLDKALVITGPDEDIMMRKMQLYLDLNDVDKAADVVNQLIRQEPKNGKYYKLLGELYDNNKLPQKAAAVYDKAQKDLPGDPAIQLGVAEHYMKAGDTTAAISYIKKAIVNNDIDPEGQIEILSAYLQSLPTYSIVIAQGLPLIRQIVRQHLDDPEILALYGDILLKNNRDSAMTEYKRSLEIKPTNFALCARFLSELPSG